MVSTAFAAALSPTLRMRDEKCPSFTTLPPAISNVPWLSMTYQLLPPLCDALVLASELRVSMPPRMTACASERFTNAPLA